MTNEKIAHLRLLNQRIASAYFQTPAEVVRWMGAVQAQDYHQALWAVGARLAAPSLQRVEQAIAAGEILRTWPMRGTIHFVPPQDAAWMVAISAERMIKRDQRRLQQLDLDAATLDRSQTLIHDALSGGQRMARPALMQQLENAGIRTGSQRGYHILWHCAQRGLICLGPNEGKQQTFVLLAEWAGQPTTLARDEALAELARRYFTSHGPAAVQDFAWWAGLTLTEARAGLDGARPALLSERIDGQEYWLADATETNGDPGGVFLLPGYDEYLLGYTDRSAVLDPQHATKISPGGNGVFFPMIVSSGQIVGTWKREITKTRVVVTRAPFTRLSAHESDGFDSAAQRYGAFLGLDIEMG